MHYTNGSRYRIEFAVSTAAWKSISRVSSKIVTRAADRSDERRGLIQKAGYGLWGGLAVFSPDGRRMILVQNWINEFQRRDSVKGGDSSRTRERVITFDVINATRYL